MKTISKTLRFLLLSFLVADEAAVAQTLYQFKCPRCGLIQTYSQWDIYKYPNDGFSIVPNGRPKEKNRKPS